MTNILTSILGNSLIQALIALVVPEAFAVLNTLVAKNPKLAPFALEISALESDVLAALTKQTTTVTAAPVAPVA